MLDPETTKELIEDPDTETLSVTPDRGRRLLDKKDFMREHLQTAVAPGPSGHGFAPGAEGDARTYYVIDHEAVSIVVLDTVNPAGFSGGSIDATQLAWLEEALIARSTRYSGMNGRLTATANADRLIVVASHHPTSDMTNTAADPAGETRYGGAHLKALLQRFPNVVLHVAGHRAQNRISAQGAVIRAGSGPQGKYWEVVTGSPLDWPAQGRLVELVDNGDGTLSIFSTMYDADAPIVPDAAKDPTPEDGVNQALLASVARRLALADPQADRDAAGLAPSDRNAELLIAAPFLLA
jgi:metallophosphoesterase (TIGR03767 family)